MTLGSLYADAIAGDTNAKIKLEMIADGLHDDWTILHFESRDGNTERVRFILKEFANKNYLIKQDKLNNTALHVAAYHGRTEVVEFLIGAAKSLPSSFYSANDDSNNPVSGYQAFVRQANNNRNTALHLAVIGGHADIVKLLVEADPSDRHILNCDGVTPLYHATSYGYTNIVEIICTTCTSPSLDDEFGSTVLHCVISRPCRTRRGKEEDIDVLKFLIDAAKRSPNETFEAILDKPNQKGKSILEEAVLGKNHDMVEVILAEHPAYQPERLPNSVSNLIPLMDMAVEKKYYYMVKLLCKTYDAGKPTVRDTKGLTVLLAALRNRDKEFVIRLLDENERLVNYADDEGLTPVHKERLVNCADDKGWTPLHHAVEYEFDSVLEVLVKAQKDSGYPFVYKHTTYTPLWLAVSRGYTSTVIRLIQVLPSYSYKNPDPNLLEILSLAASQSNKEMIKYILKFCPEEFIDKILNFKKFSCGNDTPLHVLIRNGCFVPELIKHKRVDRMAKNDQHWTPLDLLYWDDEIIAEQVLIKYALDDTQEVNKGWKFWHRNIMGKSNTPESIVPPSQRSKKDEKFKKAKNLLIAEHRERMMRELERYRKRTNTQIIVTALITTVTFTVGFTMPGGYHQSGEPDQGLVLLSKKTAFQLFMVSDALALALSITSLFIYFISSMYEDPDKVSRFDVASTVLNIISVAAMMLTFIAGIYVVLSHSQGLANIVCIICSVFFLSIIVLLIKMIKDRTEVEKLKV